MRLGVLGLLSPLLIINYHANASPLEFIERNSAVDHDAHTIIAPGKLGAVASESAICSQHGVDILKQGGNAADAVSAHFLTRGQH